MAEIFFNLTRRSGRSGYMGAIVGAGAVQVIGLSGALADKANSQ